MDNQSFYRRDIDIGIADNVMFPVIVTQVVLDILQGVLHFLADIRRYTIILTGRSAGSSSKLCSRLGNKVLLSYGVGNYRRCDRIEIEGRAYYPANFPVHISYTLIFTIFITQVFTEADPFSGFEIVVYSIIQPFPPGD